MKRLLLTVAIAFFYNNNYAQQLSFQYDNAGNQIVRQWVCINCPALNTISNSANQYQDLRLKTSPESLSTQKRLTAYPNPAIETLNVSWHTEGQEYLATIEVFTICAACESH